MSFALIQTEPFAVLKRFASDAPPDPMIWPDGCVSHCVSAGFVWSNWAIVAATSAPEAPGEFYGLTDVSPLFDGTKVVYRQTWVPYDLSVVKATLMQRLDATAEAQRYQHITPGAGQALIYQQKLGEAQAFANDTAPAAENYPLLSASVGVDGATLADVAAAVTKAAARCKAMVARIEATRLSGKAAIAAAVSVDDAVEAFNTVAWP